MTMALGMPSRDAANAIPCAWFPDENATTPERRCSSSNFDSALKAPLNLKAPIRCKFSHLKNSCSSSSLFMVVEVSTGVRWASPSSRLEAASTSSKEGSLSMADSSQFAKRSANFFHDLFSLIIVKKPLQRQKKGCRRIGNKCRTIFELTRCELARRRQRLNLH